MRSPAQNMPAARSAKTAHFSAAGALKNRASRLISTRSATIAPAAITMQMIATMNE